MSRQSFFKNVYAMGTERTFTLFWGQSMQSFVFQNTPCFFFMFAAVTAIALNDLNLYAPVMIAMSPGIRGHISSSSSQLELGVPASQKAVATLVSLL